MPLGVDSLTTKLYGSCLMGDTTDFTTCAGVHFSVLGKKASSVMWAMATSDERADSGLSADPVCIMQLRGMRYLMFGFLASFLMMRMSSGYSCPVLKKSQVGMALIRRSYMLNTLIDDVDWCPTMLQFQCVFQNIMIHAM